MLARMTATLDVSLRKKMSKLLLPRYSELLDRMNWSARWTETVRRSSNCRKFDTREDMYRHLNAEYFRSGSGPTDFFEFGVFEGTSLAFWSALNAHP